jgi:hypothetical protein
VENIDASCKCSQFNSKLFSFFVPLQGLEKNRQVKWLIFAAEAFTRLKGKLCMPIYLRFCVLRLVTEVFGEHIINLVPMVFAG